jgi:nucleotide-binding universal stress UspA family protein
MYKHILIPTDGSVLSEHAIRHGVALARTFGARVTVLTVSPPFHHVRQNPVQVAEIPEQLLLGPGVALAVAKVAAQIAGVPCETVHVTNDEPGQAIIDTAKAKHCDLIVMASHGHRDISALMIGSETIKVLTRSNVPVLVYR